LTLTPFFTSTVLIAPAHWGVDLKKERAVLKAHHIDHPLGDLLGPLEELGPNQQAFFSWVLFNRPAPPLSLFRFALQKTA
jgi:hypothetical protein